MTTMPANEIAFRAFGWFGWVSFDEDDCMIEARILIDSSDDFGWVCVKHFLGIDTSPDIQKEDSSHPWVAFPPPKSYSVHSPLEPIISFPNHNLIYMTIHSDKFNGFAHNNRSNLNINISLHCTRAIWMQCDEGILVTLPISEPLSSFHQRACSRNMDPFKIIAMKSIWYVLLLPCSWINCFDWIMDIWHVGNELAILFECWCIIDNFWRISLKNLKQILEENFHRRRHRRHELNLSLNK